MRHELTVAGREGHASRTRLRLVALMGNPNSGKTTLFNALTGLRQRVGNYPGVTVEKKEGHLTTNAGEEITVLDLPGSYSLTPHSPDEAIAIDVALGQSPYVSKPDLILCVVDATNLERNLFLVTQLIDREIPVIVVLTMVDSAEQEGLHVERELLSRGLGVPVIPVVASKGIGLQELHSAMGVPTLPGASMTLSRLPEVVSREVIAIALAIARSENPGTTEIHRAVELLSTPEPLPGTLTGSLPEVIALLRTAHEKLEFLGYDPRSVFIEARYAWIKNLVARVIPSTTRHTTSLTDVLDRYLTHRIWGVPIFFLIMALMFQGIFSWASLPTEWILAGFDRLGTTVVSVMPPGDLRNLIVDGAFAGVSSVVSFLPQIAFLFFFLGLLEDSGYMARAAFIMDRIMSKVGLHGRSFIPLLGSFACAIPGIMATRTIDSPRDRLVTMLVAPLMSCSARLPVYSLLIAAFIPPVAVFGIFSLPGLTLLGLYVLGMVAALGMALVFKKTLLRGAPPPFIIELPPYRTPSLRSVSYQVWDKAGSFLRTAGTIILGASIILWFLAAYPKSGQGSPADQIQHSFAGTIGKSIEPVLRPLGFDWKIGIGLITSLMQREAFISAMGTIYNIQADTDGTVSLRQAIRQDINPATGKPTFTLLTAICLMVYYVLAMQCLATVAIMRRETNSWRWPLFQIAYMSVLAYGVTFVVYRVGILFGVGI